jgi:hypothetical protein
MLKHITVRREGCLEPFVLHDKPVVDVALSCGVRKDDSTETDGPQVAYSFSQNAGYSGFATFAGQVHEGDKYTFTFDVGSVNGHAFGGFEAIVGYNPSGLKGGGVTYATLFGNGTPAAGTWETETLTYTFASGTLTPTGQVFLYLLGYGNNTVELFDNVRVSYDNGVTAAVPEPTTWAMLLLGFAGIGFMAYRRKSKPALMTA